MLRSDDKNLQKVTADGKLQKAASANQHHVGKLQQGQQQHMVVVEEGDINDNMRKKKIAKRRVVEVDPAADKLARGRRSHS